jgi:hypothetical protein
MGLEVRRAAPALGLRGSRAGACARRPESRARGGAALARACRPVRGGTRGQRRVGWSGRVGEASRQSGTRCIDGGREGGDAARWITNGPRAALSEGGTVDQKVAEGWIRGRAPLKPRLERPSGAPSRLPPRPSHPLRLERSGEACSCWSLDTLRYGARPAGGRSAPTNR